MIERDMDTAEKKRPSRSCFFGHTWSKWEVYEVHGGKLLGNEMRDCIYTYQRRVCLVCNRVQDEHIRG